MNNMKIINFYKQNLVYKLLITVLSLIVIILIVFPKKVDSYKWSGKDDFAAEIIKEDKIYSQEFVSNVNKLSEIGIRFSTYQVNNKNGKLNIKVVDEKKKNIYKLEDNKIFYIKFNEINNSKNKKYTIEFKYSDYNDGNSLTYWAFNDSNKKMKINGKNTNYSLNFSTKGKALDYSLVWYPIVIIVILSLIKCADEVDKNEKK